MNLSLPKNLITLSTAIKQAGGKLFIVGGYVRNHLLSLPAYDIDICSAFTPQQIIGVVQQLGWSHKLISKKLGTVKIIVDSESYEHTTFRKDSYQKGGQHTPSDVKFIDNIKADALRRDFTCNAIYYDIENASTIDYFNGITDIKNKKLKIINSDVFKSDGLRLLRLIRFALTLNFKIDKNTMKNAIEYKHQLKDISAERIKDEFKKITYLNCINAKRFIYLLNKLACLRYISPTLANITLKEKHFNLFALDSQFRYTAFYMLLLASYFDYKPTTHHQVIFACHKIFGVDALKESNKSLSDIYSTYIVFQQSFTTKPNLTFELVCDYYNYNQFIKDFICQVAPALHNLLQQKINGYIDNNLPLNESQLKITNMQLLNANIENIYISKIKRILFNLCITKQIKNEKDILIATAKKVAERLQQKTELQ